MRTYQSGGTAVEYYSNLRPLAGKIGVIAEAASRATAEAWLEGALQLVPVDTGALRDSGHVEEEYRAGGIMGTGLRARRIYAVVFDARAPSNDAEYAGFVEFGTMNMDAQPFLGPSMPEAVSRGRGFLFGGMRAALK